MTRNGPPRALVSYAHQDEDPGHAELVRHFWQFLRECGIDARIDLTADVRRQDWALWMADQIRESDFVLVVGSPAYRERAEGRGSSDIGRGVQWEARLIRDAFYRDQRGLDRFVPVVLPGQTIDGIPDFLAPASSSVYYVPEFTLAGAESLLRLLTAQPAIIEPPLGSVPVLEPQPVPPAPQPRQPRPRPEPGVSNTLIGNVSGFVLQAGSVGSVRAPIDERPAHVVGAGVRGWKSAFENHYAFVRRQVAIGDPTTDVEPYGPGVRQEFSGGWVLCALPDHPVMAVAEPIWEALHVLGSGVLHAEPVAAIGLPVSDGSPALIDDDALGVDLAGGAWGPSSLVRPGLSQDWEWRPKSDNFSRTMTRAARNWTGGSPVPRLRIRAIASLNVVRSADWEITPERRSRFDDVLPVSDLSEIVGWLSLDCPVDPWERRANANYPDRAGYFRQAMSPDDGLVLEAEVMAAVSGGNGVVTCAELRLDDERRLTLTEVREFLVAAWQMATTDLLDLLAFPRSRLRWREVPTVEFRLTAEHDGAVVADLINFAPFGLAPEQHHAEMAVTVPAVPFLPDEERRRLTRGALAYLGRNFGYLEASADRL